MMQTFFAILWFGLAIWNFLEGEETNALVALAISHIHVLHAELEARRA